MGLANREWASIILLALLLLIGMFNPSVRLSLVSVLKLVANRHIIVVVATYISLLVGISVVIVRTGFWNWDRWPNLVLWSLFAGFPVVFSVTEAGKQEGLFRSKAMDAIGLSAFVGLIAEVHSFPLAIELTLPILTILFWFGGYGSQQPLQNRSCFRVALLVTAVVIIGNSAWWIVAKSDFTWAKEQAMSFVVVMVWTCATLLFLFIFSVYAVYQIAFLSFGFSRVAPSISMWKAKLAVVSGIGLDIELAHKFKPYWAGRVLKASSFSTARSRIEEFKYEMYSRSEQQRREELKLMHNAGIEGVDDSGRQLDKREFKETIEVLDWLWTCHAGRYSKSNRYEKETLDIVALGGFKGLPDEHGINMKISDDGLLWYAHRQTIGGWYFAVGSNGPRSMPGNKWYYDGPVSPLKWPSADEWDIVPGETYSGNWLAGY